MGKFNHAFLPDVNLERVDTGTSRYYVDKEKNKYVSVTTALKVLSDRGIQDWKSRVGEEDAAKITKKAGSQGTTLHAIAEKYLLNEEQTYFPGSFDVKFLFNNFLKKVLEENVSTIYGIEKKLYSKEIRAAGTADLICDYANIPSICDIKTSKYIKERDKIHAYFLQCGSYAIMLEELFGFRVEQIVIMMACHYDSGKVYIEDIEPWKKKARKFFELFHADFFKVV